MSKFRIDVRSIHNLDSVTAAADSTFLVARHSLQDDLPKSLATIPGCLLPSDALSKWWKDCGEWHEYCRRYSVELTNHFDQCEQLRSTAESHGLNLVYIDKDNRPNDAEALKKHLVLLECKHRWNKGLIIGGYTKPIKHEIQRQGGIWYPWHRAWMMPDETSYRYVLSLFPVDI